MVCIYKLVGSCASINASAIVQSEVSITGCAGISWGTFSTVVWAFMAPAVPLKETCWARVLTEWLISIWIRVAYCYLVRVRALESCIVLALITVWVASNASSSCKVSVKIRRASLEASELIVLVDVAEVVALASSACSIGIAFRTSCRAWLAFIRWTVKELAA